jgi:WD40 repeat protein
MQQADAPISSVALSDDGRHVASAAGRIARAATVTDGRLVAEVQAESVVTAMAFAPTAGGLAVADAAGTVTLAPLADGRRAAVRLGAAAVALALAPDGNHLAIGDAGGTITLVDAASWETAGTTRHWPQPIRWLEFSPDGSALLVATDSWLHALATTNLAPAHSTLVVWPAADTVATAISATTIGFAGVTTDGSLISGVLDLAALEPREDAAALVARDWSAVLGLRLNDNGDPVPFAP